jgi:NAD(P)-dependent dehydrogenase (short-subunit alcohol dehydrogenase family)
MAPRLRGGDQKGWSFEMNVRKLLDLSGKVALVTGASRGLGLQIATALGEMGARLAICSRKAADLESAMTGLKAAGIEVIAVPCDLGNPESIAQSAKAVLAQYGKVDVLVNNAGATWGQPAEQHDYAGWRKVIGTNLDGTFLLTQAIARDSMIPRKSGRIINVASVAGLAGQHPGIMQTLAYNTSKGGLVNFTRQLASEWGKYGIAINAICPGYFPTKMSNHTIEHNGQFILERTPMLRFGGEDDLKGIAVLLASDASAYLTGQAIAVDGGMMAV